MFGLGMLEILMVALLAVMLFPPKDLPKLAKGLARIYGSLRKSADDFRNALWKDEDLRKPFEEVREAYQEARWEFYRAEKDARDAADFSDSDDSDDVDQNSETEKLEAAEDKPRSQSDSATKLSSGDSASGSSGPVPRGSSDDLPHAGDQGSVETETETETGKAGSLEIDDPFADPAPPPKIGQKHGAGALEGRVAQGQFEDKVAAPEESSISEDFAADSASEAGQPFRSGDSGIEELELDDALVEEVPSAPPPLPPPPRGSKS